MAKNPSSEPYGTDKPSSAPSNSCLHSFQSSICSESKAFLGTCVLSNAPAVFATRFFCHFLAVLLQIGALEVQPHRNARLGHMLLDLAHGESAEMEHARGQDRVRFAFDDALGKMIERARTA